jgi:D-alanine-D-alanine ligase
MTKHVAVLMGGLSVERDVSLRSGEACAKALEAEGYKVTRVDMDRNVAETLANLRPDVAFNALHGRFGEDGIMQGILEMLRIPLEKLPAFCPVSPRFAPYFHVMYCIPTNRSSNRLQC